MSSPSAANDRCSCLFSGDDDDHDEQINNRSCPHCRRSNSALLSSYSSSSLLSFDSIPVEDYDKRWRIVQASIKGFTIGAGIKGGLALFSLLARFRRRRSLSSAKKVEMASSSEDLTLAVKETLRYGLFLGAFAGTYVSVDELIAAIGGHHSKMEGFVSRGDSGAFNASDWIEHRTYKLGHLHSYACCCLGIPMRNKE